MLLRVASDANIPVKLEGVLLCGGRSSRMGRDKALIELNGEALWIRQRRQLKELLGAEPLLSVRAGSTLASAGVEPSELRYVYDDGSSGPLGGILAGFDAVASARATHLAVLAVDMPFMEMDWWKALMSTCDAMSGAVGRRGDDARSSEPLAAIYPIAMAALLGNAKASGDFSLQRIVAEGVSVGLLREVQITAEREKLFLNWNTPEDIK